jgi:hypothetical protein
MTGHNMTVLNRLVFVLNGKKAVMDEVSPSSNKEIKIDRKRLEKEAKNVKVRKY